MNLGGGSDVKSWYVLWIKPLQKGCKVCGVWTLPTHNRPRQWGLQKAWAVLTILHEKLHVPVLSKWIPWTERSPAPAAGSAAEVQVGNMLIFCVQCCVFCGYLVHSLFFWGGGEKKEEGELWKYMDFHVDRPTEGHSTHRERGWFEPALIPTLDSHSLLKCLHHDFISLLQKQS